jgi:hypothetical protein
MNEKEMCAHIKLLTTIIKEQSEALQHFHTSMRGLHREIVILFSKVGRLEGRKDD